MTFICVEAVGAVLTFVDLVPVAALRGRVRTVWPAEPGRSPGGAGPAVGGLGRWLGEK
jgi:hypothetical protein